LDWIGVGDGDLRRGGHDGDPSTMMRFFNEAFPVEVYQRGRREAELFEIVVLPPLESATGSPFSSMTPIHR